MIWIARKIFSCAAEEFVANCQGHSRLMDHYLLQHITDLRLMSMLSTFGARRIIRVLPSLVRMSGLYGRTSLPMRSLPGIDRISRQQDKPRLETRCVQVHRVLTLHQQTWNGKITSLYRRGHLQLVRLDEGRKDRENVLTILRFKTQVLLLFRGLKSFTINWNTTPTL